MPSLKFKSTHCLFGVYEVSCKAYQCFISAVCTYKEWVEYLYILTSI